MDKEASNFHERLNLYDNFQKLVLLSVKLVLEIGTLVLLVVYW